MTGRFLAGLVLTAVALPYNAWKLRRATLRADEAADRPVAVLDLPPIEKPVLAVVPPPPAPAPHDVIPLPVRSTPPCHDCVCCSAYGARMLRAHHEIQRLRDELLHDDARRINTAAVWGAPQPRSGS